MITWVVAIFGWVAVYSLPDQYESRAIVHIDTKSIIRPLLKGLAVESRVESGLTIMKQLLLSRKNLEGIIRQTDMGLKVNSPEAMDRARRYLSGSITLKKQKRSDIYVLSHQGNDADLVYQIVSKLLDTIIETTIDSARTDTIAAQKFIENQITEYEERLVEAEQRLAEFKRHNLGVMPGKTGGYYNKLQQEQGELKRLRSELLIVENKLLEMHKQLKGETSLLGNSDYNSLQILKLRRYREQLEILLSNFTEQHPDVVALRNTIAEVSTKGIGEQKFIGIGEGDSIEFNPIYQQLKAEIHKVSIEVETSKLKVVEKEKVVAKLNQSVDIMPVVEAELAKLNRDYEITRKRHLGLIERRESARMAQAVGKSGSNIDFRVIESPRVEVIPSGPNRMLFLTGVFFVALGAGLGWGFLRYYVQPTFIVSSQISSKVGVPILGSVGLYMTVQHQKRRRMQLTLFMLIFSLLIVFYGGVVAYRETSSGLVNELISLRSSAT